MNKELFLEYRAAPDGAKKRLLLERLVKENIGLVKKFVDRFMKHTSIPLPREDMEQAALIGLTRALQKLDPEKGKLSSYAAHWIRREMQTESRLHTDIYRPEGTGVPWDVVRANEGIQAALGRPGTAEELSFETGKDISDDDVERYRTEAPKYDRGIMNYSGDTDTPQAVVPQALLDISKPTEPDERLMASETAQRLYRFVDTLEGKQRAVMSYLAQGMEDKAICLKCQITDGELRRYRGVLKRKAKRSLNAG